MGSVYKTYVVLASPWKFLISGPKIRNCWGDPGAGFKKSGMNKERDQQEHLRKKRKIAAKHAQKAQISMRIRVVGAVLRGASF